MAQGYIMKRAGRAIIKWQYVFALWGKVTRFHRYQNFLQVPYVSFQLRIHVTARNVDRIQTGDDVEVFPWQHDSHGCSLRV